MDKIVFLAALIAGGVIAANMAAREQLTPKSLTAPQVAINPRTAPVQETIVTGLAVPWAISFLPDGSFLFTQRQGSLTRFHNGSLFKIADIEGVVQTGEGGLLGVAVSPRYEENGYIFLYHTFAGSGNNILNRLVRYRFENNSLNDRKILIDNIPGSSNHDGGRIKFGPDGYLYVTTGDAQEPSLSQRTDTLAGKILRVNEDGTSAPNNPYGNEIFSYGHRNPQGIAWNGVNLYSTEHGPSTMDEVNLITKGENYGWPDIQGDMRSASMRSPLIHSKNDTWAPSGLAYYNGSLYFAGLRGSALYRLILRDGEAQLKEYFKDEFGRIREAVLGPDNMLYITTSNKDGRSSPADSDDRIIRINPSKL